MDWRKENLQKFLVLKETRKGKAVFSKAEIRKDSFIILFTGDIYTKDQYLARADRDNNHFLQIDTESFMGPSWGIDDFINHSCDPNCGLIYSGDKIGLFAIRHIQKGEEICFDYSTTMAEDFWEMACLCGAGNCRKMIRDFKHLPLPTQQRYISLNIVAPFISSNFKTHT